MTEQWRAVTRLERADFYSDWLARSQENEQVVHRDPVVARGKDVIYVETPQDYRIGMLIGEQVGFPTNGTNLCQAYIPAGHHTGKHRHGEEAIHHRLEAGEDHPAFAVAGQDHVVAAGGGAHKRLPGRPGSYDGAAVTGGNVIEDVGRGHRHGDHPAPVGTQHQVG